jgi:hypothetical protein
MQEDVKIGRLRLSSRISGTEKLDDEWNSQQNEETPITHQVSLEDINK